MPRLPRVHVEGSIHYVTCKGTENQRIFRDKADYKMYLDVLAKTKKETGCKLYAYALAPDRLFLLLEPVQSSISEIMHKLNSFYTKYFNSRVQRRGPLFESRFKSVYAEKAAYLAELARHIHRAPRRLGAPESETSLSAYAGTAGPDAPEMSQETSEVLASLGMDRESYLRYVEAQTPDAEAALEKKLGRGSVLGSEAFAAAVKRAAEAAADVREEAVRAKITPFRRMLAAALVALALTLGYAAYVQTKNEALKKHYEAVVRDMQESLATGSPLAAAPAGEGVR